MEEVTGGGSHFNTGNSNVEFEPSKDHRKELDSEDREAVVTAKSVTTARVLSEKFNFRHTTVLHELKRIEKVSVVEKWVTCKMSPIKTIEVIWRL